MQASFEVDITPSVTTYELYQNISYTHWFSIGEFIDNAITSAVMNRELLKQTYGEDYQLVINIELDVDKSEIKITDNAAGISVSEMHKALRAGEPPENKSLLSVHGVGMKMSAFWLGRNLQVETQTIGADYGLAATVDLDKLNVTKESRIEVTKVPPQKVSGTVVTISRISEGKWPAGRTQGKLKALLSSMYRKFLTDPDNPIKISIQGQPLSFVHPKILIEPFWPNTQGPETGALKQEWIRDFSFVTSRGHEIFGRVGLLEKMSRDLSGFYLHFRGKGVGGIGIAVGEDTDSIQSALKDSREFYRPQSIFGQEGGYRYQRFTGEFDISSLGKTSSTDSIKWNEDEQQEFLDALEKFLKDPDFNLWAMAENYQSRRSKQLIAAGNQFSSTEFSVTEIEEITNSFLHSIRPDVLVHEEDEELSQNFSKILEVSDEEFMQSSKEWLVRDHSHHVHKVRSNFIEDARLEMFDLHTLDDYTHEIRINLGHPFLRKFQWGNKDVRAAVITMIFLMAIPEILLPIRCSNAAFKRKIFELVESTMGISREEAL